MGLEFRQPSIRLSAPAVLAECLRLQPLHGVLCGQDHLLHDDGRVRPGAGEKKKDSAPLVQAPATL